MKPAYAILLFLFIANISNGQPSDRDIKQVLAEINSLRSKGCQCGNKWMPPSQALAWNKELYKISNRYARYMARNRHFDHISKEGEDLGDRMDKAGLRWLKIGENLGYGYKDFYSVLNAWKKSPSHCRMLMDPDMTELGMSKHKTYWVQSFLGYPANLSFGDDN